MRPRHIYGIFLVRFPRSRDSSFRPVVSVLYTVPQKGKTAVLCGKSCGQSGITCILPAYNPNAAFLPRDPETVDNAAVDNVNNGDKRALDPASYPGLLQFPEKYAKIEGRILGSVPFRRALSGSPFLYPHVFLSLPQACPQAASRKTRPWKRFSTLSPPLLLLLKIYR